MQDEREEELRKPVRFLRIFGFLCALVFTGPALAAGYSCPAYMKYTSCTAGYYMTVGGNYNGAPTVGNSCTACPTGCTCAGGTADKVCCVETSDSCANHLGAGWEGTAYYRCPGKAWDYTACKHTQACTPTNSVSNATSTTCPGGTQTKDYNGSYSACSTSCTAATCNASFYKNDTACTACNTLSDGSFTSSSVGNSSGPNACYKSCSVACTRPGCPSSASCSFGSEVGNGTHIYGGSCSAVPPACSATKTCNSGFYGDSNVSSTCSACTNAKPTGAAYTGNSTINNCPWGNVTIPAGQYYEFSTKSFKTCPTGQYCPGGANVNSSTGANTGISGACTNTPSNTSSWSYTGTGAASAGACLIQISSCNANYVYVNNGTASATCNACTTCAAGTGATCSLSVVGNACNYATGCSTGYGNIQNSGAYNPVCSANAYTVTLTQTPGAGGTSSVTATYNAPMPSAVMPTLANYKFTGYSDTTTGGTQYYNTVGASARNWDKAANATLYAQWAQSGAVCAAGQYLPKNVASCTICTGANYCPGGTYSLSSTADQGITQCPGGYTADTSNGKYSASECKINVADGNYIASSGESQKSCAAGTSKAAHTVAYGSISACAACMNATYSAAGAGSCTDCPTGYTANTASNKITASECQISVAAGKYLSTASTTITGSCAAGTSKVEHLVNYGLTSVCAACTNATYSAAGAGSCTDCPTGYTANTASNKTDATQCQISVAAGYYVGTKNSSTPDTCIAGTFKASHDVNYGSVSSCAVCAANTYSGAGVASCSACLTNYATAGTTAANHDSAADCKISCPGGTYLAVANSTTCSDVGNGFWSSGTTDISQGTTSPRTACPTGYANSNNDRDTQKTCYTICSAGTHVATAGGTCSTLTTNDKYIIENYVYYGDTSIAATCNTANGYQITDKILATDHDAVTDCKVNCDAGTHVALADSACSECPAGQFCESATISYGSTGNAQNCPVSYTAGGTGLVTESQCQITCPGGSYVATGTADCSALTLDDKYVAEHNVNYGSISVPDTCDITNNYHIIEKSNADEHDSQTDCYQTCAMESIEPPVGAFKMPKNVTEYYPTFCVYTATCPKGYLPEEGGNKYDDSGYTSAPTCETTPFFITFLANGGDFTGTGLSYTKKCQVGASCALTDADLTKFSRPGFEFGGWAKTTTGPAVYQNGENISGMEVVTLNLYAVWAKCADGYSWNGKACVLCPIGSWASDTDATGVGAACVSCGAGGTTDGSGSTSADDCKICPENNYCGINGGAVKSCSTLGDGSWASSDAGSQIEKNCYKSCPDYPLTFGTATAKNAVEFYPIGCQYSCVSDTGNSGRIENGTCVETVCKNTSEMINGFCKPCDRENALSYKPGANCVIETCVMGYHPNGQKCDENIVQCSAPNAIEAEQKWDFNLKAYGICTIKTCDAGYHLSSNACVLDDQACAVENGTGVKAWDPIKNTWDKCIVTSCNPGYSDDTSETNELSKACGQCKNKFSVLGELAASSYAVGCEIAACMYQGELYNLDNNECVPICDVNGYEDETGNMKWDSSRKKCVRQCKEGYTMW